MKETRSLTVQVSEPVTTLREGMLPSLDLLLEAVARGEPVEDEHAFVLLEAGNGLLAGSLCRCRGHAGPGQGQDGDVFSQGVRAADAAVPGLLRVLHFQAGPGGCGGQAVHDSRRTCWRW